jgi:YNFM family putative membrane transporter
VSNTQAIDTRHRSGQPGFRRIAVAMFAAGIATFTLLYLTQPLLPLISERFGVSAATSSLTLAVTTAALALALLPAAWLADRWGRTTVMSASLCASAVLALLAALAPSFGVLLALRALQGVAIAGLPAVAMTYLAEEVHPTSLGASIGLYIGGNAIGGMAGRLAAGALADVGGWRLSLAGVGAFSLLCALLFIRLIPASANVPRGPARSLGARLLIHLRDDGQRRLDLIAALLMGTFVAVYNALGFRLAAAPYDLGQAAIAAVFLVYPIGSLSSAWAGRLADRVGRRSVLPCGVLLAAAGVAITALQPLALVVLGIALFTAGFFAAHSVASSWVGRRAHRAPAQASALYLLSFYVGSSVAGPLGGAAWSAGRWPEVMALALGLLALALVVSLRLRGTPPLAPPLQTAAA